MTVHDLNPATVLTDAVGTVHQPCSSGARIVSLVPSVTELLVDLDLGRNLVGRTGFCVHPRHALREIPKLGGTKDVNLERLRATEPTHVIVNIDENRRETVEAMAGFVPNVVVTHPCRPSDNFALYRLLGTIFGRRTQAEALCKDLEAALDLAAGVRQRLAAERVLYLIWREPWMTVSPATYIAATLASVGWNSWPDDVSPRYPQVSLAAASSAGVERVLLSSEPYRFRTRHLAEVEGLSARPCLLIDGTMTSWYGSRAPTGLRYLAELRQRLSESR